MALSIKVWVDETNQKTMKFMLDMSVAEAIKEIREKTDKGGADHGLFQPAGKDTTARWLKEERTLGHYSLTEGCELYYRKKHQLLRIKLPDGTITLLVDLTLPVEDIVQFIGDKKNISNAAEYSLCYEDGQWLLSHQALEEQGVKLDQILVLKKKLFLLDGQLSREDPVAIHFLYCQARDQVVTGDLPVPKNEIKELAALQCTISEGKYVPDKHVPGYFDWKLYLPPSYRKEKTLEKEILTEFKKKVGMSETEAKYRYIQVCRSLPAWGMAIFNAKIPDVKKKDKKILIGITRQNITFLDAETREAMKSWHLKQLKRYAASGANKSLTLDFGDHEDTYKTIFSDDSERIAALITEYIDLILKTRKDNAKTVELDTETVAKEEALALQRAQAYMSTTNIFLPGGASMQAYSTSGSVAPGHASFKKPGTMRKLNEVQIAVGQLGTMLNDLKHVGHHAQGSSMSQQGWLSQMATSMPGFRAAVDQFIEMLTQPGVTQEQIDEAVKLLMQKAEAVIKAARYSAVTGKEPNEGLLDAAKAVGDSLKNLFSCLDLVRQDQTASPPMQGAMLLASKAVKASVGFVDSALKGANTDATSQELMLEAMRNLDYSLMQLLNSAKKVSDGVLDASKKQELENYSKALYATSRVLDSAINDFAPAGVIPECRAFMISSAQTTSIALNNLLTSMKNGVKMDPIQQSNLLGAARDCAEALATLMNAVDVAEGAVNANQDMVSLLEQLKAIAGQLKQGTGNKNALTAQIKDITAVTHGIITATKSVAETADDKTKGRLVISTKSVADALAKLMHAAKTCITTPHVLSAQTELINSADHLEQAGQDLIEEAARIYALSSIRQLSKTAAAAASSLISYSKRVPAESLELPQQNQLTSTVKAASECIAQLLKCLKEAKTDALNEEFQFKLVTAAQESIVPCMDLSAFTKRINPKVSELGLRHDLKEASDRIAQASQKLMNACKLVNSAGGADAAEALEQLASALGEMEAAEFAVQTATLKPTYSQSRDEALALLTVSTRNVHALQNKVKNAVKSSPKQGLRNMKDLCLAVSETSSAAKSVAALNPDRVTQGRIVASAKQFIKDAEAVVNACKALVANSNNNEVAEALHNTMGKLTSSTTNLIATSRGFDSKACDEAVALINEHARGFQTIQAPHGKDLGSTTDDITAYIKAMSAAVSQLTNMAKTNPKNVGASAKMLASILPSYVESINIAAALSNNPVQNAKVVEDSKDLFRNMATLVEMAKAYAANPEPSSDANVVAASATVNDALNQILATLGGKLNNKDCEEAIELILGSARTLDEETPASDSNKPTIEVIQDLTSNVKELANVTAQIVAAARLTPEQLGKASRDAAETMKIISESAKAAGMKVAPHPDILAHTRTLKEAVQASVEHWEDPKLVVQNARIIGSAVKTLFESCKNIVREIPPENAKALIAATQALGGYVAHFMAAMKAQENREPGAHEALIKSATELTEHLGKVATLSAVIDANDKGANPQLHKKLIDHVRAVAATTTQLISGAMEVSNKPKDNNALFQLSSASKNVSDAVANLLKACGALQPGFADCEEAIEIVQTGIGDLDATAIALAVGNMEKTDNNVSHQECQEELVQLARAIANGVNETVNASRFESPEGIGKAVKALAESVPVLVMRSKQAVSTTNDTHAQNALLTSAKEISDAVLHQVQACRSVIANTDSKDAHKEIISSAKQVSDAIGSMVSSLKTGVILLRDLDEAINSIKAVITSLEEPNKGSGGKTFDDAKEDLNDNAKAFAAAIKKVVTADKSNLVQMGNAAKEVAAAVPPLAYSCKIAAAAATDSKISQQIMAQIKDIANGTKALVQHAKTAASDNSQQAVQGIQDSFRSLTQGLGKLMDAAKQGAVGEIAIEEALSSINKTTAALDAALIFAAAGQLEPDPDQNATVADLQQNVVAQAKLVGESSVALTRSIKGTKEQFGNGAKAVADAVARLVAASESMSKGIGDLSTQQELLGGTKAAVTFSQQLVNTGKDAQRFKQDAGLAKAVSKVQQSLNESLHHVVNVVQNAEKDAARGIQQIATTKNEIQKLIDAFDSQPAAGKAAAEDVVKAARLLAAASAQMSAASVDREQVNPASKTGIDASTQLLNTAKAIEASFAGTPEADKTSQASKSAVTAFASLVGAVKELLTTGVGQQSLSDGSTAVADKISDLITAARALPGGAHLKLEENTGIDLEETAASELNQACQMIENTIATLIANKPAPKPKTPGVAFDLSNIAEAVYDCCIAIAGAAQKLVQATAEFQNNRVDNQKQNPHVYRKDPMWADGLISAAKSIAGATQMLVKSADAVARGEAKEEEIEAVARSIGGATAQLVAAARVKQDTNSSSYHHLSQAAKSVASAVTKLVAAAKQFTVAEEEGEEEEQASTYTSNAIKQYNQQIRILRAEKELERARNALLQARKKEYQK